MVKMLAPLKSNENKSTHSHEFQRGMWMCVSVSMYTVHYTTIHIYTYVWLIY